jgi:hypothetical protein
MTIESFYEVHWLPFAVALETPREERAEIYEHITRATSIEDAAGRFARTVPDEHWQDDTIVLYVREDDNTNAVVTRVECRRTVTIGAQEPVKDLKRLLTKSRAAERERIAVAKARFDRAWQSTRS